jgi:hypothetical protein
MNKSASLTPVQGPLTVVRYPEERYLKCALNAMEKTKAVEACSSPALLTSSYL